MMKTSSTYRFFEDVQLFIDLFRGAGNALFLALWATVIGGSALYGVCRDAYAADESPTRETNSAFAFAQLETLAKQLADQPYTPPEEVVPDFLRALTREQWRAIRYRSENTSASGNANDAFAVDFLYPGSIFTHTVRINIVDGPRVRPLVFSPEMFEVADEKLAEQLRQLQLGFAGFSLSYPGAPANVGEDDDTLGLMGTSHFQFRGRKARYGGDARLVALDTAAPSGEQRPFFREYWLHSPDSDAKEFVIHALMDSPGMTGAFEIVVTPGTTMILDVHAGFFRRGTSRPAKIGLAPITGMFLFSETGRGDISDYRPEVHSCDGLLMAANDNDWRWVPLKNPQRLAINSFELDRPRGFGFMQRDTNFDHYQDLRNRLERCSSLWVEPKGDWGAGGIELVEIPSDKDIHSNIMAYWIPADDSPLSRAAGVSKPDAESADGNAPLILDYRLYWMPPDIPMHELGAARDTRIARTPEADGITFVIDFEGGLLNALPADTGLTSVVDAPPEAPLLDKQLMKNEVTGGWRLVLKFGLPQDGVLTRLLAARDGPAPLRFSAHLKRGENLAEVLTEKWIYNWAP